VIVLLIDANRPGNVPSSKRPKLDIAAVRAKHALKTPTLTSFRQDPYMKVLTTRGYVGLTFDTPPAVVLGGLPAFRYVAHGKGLTITNYSVVQGQYFYNLNLVVPTKTPAAMTAALQAALRSFRVTQ
jgi:hypothetical protein